jgi:hypothetical protein
MRKYSKRQVADAVSFVLFLRWDFANFAWIGIELAVLLPPFLKYLEWQVCVNIFHYIWVFLSYGKKE